MALPSMGTRIIPLDAANASFLEGLTRICWHARSRYSVLKSKSQLVEADRKDWTTADH